MGELKIIKPHIKRMQRSGFYGGAGERDFYYIVKKQLN